MPLLRPCTHCRPCCDRGSCCLLRRCTVAAHACNALQVSEGKTGHLSFEYVARGNWQIHWQKGRHKAFNSLCSCGHCAAAISNVVGGVEELDCGIGGSCCFCMGAVPSNHPVQYMLLLRCVLDAIVTNGPQAYLGRHPRRIACDTSRAKSLSANCTVFFAFITQMERLLAGRNACGGVGEVS
jgi:hypothetical protein